MAKQPLSNHPGRVLHDEVMKPLGVSRNRLARDIDVPVGRISAIVSGSRAITADTALRLAKYFGTTPELWLKLQSDYDLAVVRATTWSKVDPRVRVLDSTAPGLESSVREPVETAMPEPPTAQEPTQAAVEEQPSTQEPIEPPSEEPPISTQPD